MRRGVLEPKHIRVKRLAREPGRGGKGLFFLRRPGARRLAGAAVRRIADQGMAQMREMHADLMGAAGFEPAFHKTGKGLFGIAVTFDDTITRARGFTLSAQDRHAFAIERAAADLAFDQPFAETRAAPHDGVIGALDGVGGELFGKALHGALVLGGDEKPARILVEAVDDAGPGHAAHARQLRPAMGDERIDQRAVGIAGRRMDDKPRGLLDDDKILVLVNDMKRNVFALGRCGRGRWNGDFVGLAGFDPPVGVSYFRARKRDGAGVDQALQPGTAEIGKRRSQKAVEPLTGVLAADMSGPQCSVYGG